MPSLRELRAEFVKVLEEKDGNWKVLQFKDVPFAEAQGLQYLCPKCYVANGGSVGTHSILNWFRGKVPDTYSAGPGRWTPEGTGIDDLSFVPGSPPMMKSVRILQGCKAHFWVTKGQTVAT